MPTVGFFYQKKEKGYIPVHCRLSISRKKMLRRKTGLIADADFINKYLKGNKTPREASLKTLYNGFKELEDHILDEYNNALIKKIEVDSKWLGEVINSHLNIGQEKETDLNLLSNFCQNYLDRLKFKVNKKLGKQISDGTIKKYATIVRKLNNFQSFKKLDIRLNQFNIEMIEEFQKFLESEEGLTKNTVGRYTRFVKTILFDAEKRGFEISNQVKNFEGFKIDVPKVVLSIDELEILKALNLKEEVLDIARDWLIIGCYTGQRVSDLLRMEKSMIKKISGYEFIVLSQKKTKKTVQIPIHNEVREILNKRDGDFPKKFTENIESSATIFNRKIKEICKQAKFNYLVEAYHTNEVNGNYEKGKYEKWKLISSHVCRRSFATNFYAEEKYPTPLLMNITGHSTESMFLEYIAKEPIDFSLMLAKIWGNEQY